jgi:hypothetical protein
MSDLGHLSPWRAPRNHVSCTLEELSKSSRRKNFLQCAKSHWSSGGIRLRQFSRGNNASGLAELVLLQFAANSATEPPEPKPSSMLGSSSWVAVRDHSALDTERTG